MKPHRRNGKIRRANSSPRLSAASPVLCTGFCCFENRLPPALTLRALATSETIKSLRPRRGSSKTRVTTRTDTLHSRKPSIIAQEALWSERPSPGSSACGLSSSLQDAEHILRPTASDELAPALQHVGPRRARPSPCCCRRIARRQRSDQPGWAGVWKRLSR